MIIPLRFGFGEKPRNLGPVCLLPCTNCRETLLFNLIAQHMRFTFWFIPIGPGHESYALQCSKCGGHLVLPEEDAGNALAINREIAARAEREISAGELQALIEKYPLRSVKQWVVTNTDRQCPKCKSEVPLNYNECWNCGYLFH